MQYEWFGSLHTAGNKSCGAFKLNILCSGHYTMHPVVNRKDMGANHFLLVFYYMCVCMCIYVTESETEIQIECERAGEVEST